jgi:hypothetical protein
MMSFFQVAKYVYEVRGIILLLGAMFVHTFCLIALLYFLLHFLLHLKWMSRKPPFYADFTDIRFLRIPPPAFIKVAIFPVNSMVVGD